MSGRLVVVGGDAAGMSAASLARRLSPDLEIVVVERGRHISYAACGLSYLVGGLVEVPERLLAVTPEQARAERRLDLRLEHEVRDIDLVGRTVSGTDHATGSPFAVGFDRLVLATGARPMIPPIPGVEARGVFVVRQFHHGLALHEFLEARRPSRAVIAGTGYVGLDFAEAFRARGLSVTLLRHQSSTLLGLEPEPSAMVEEALVRAGCVLLRDAPLYAVEADGAGFVTGVKAGGERLDADLVVLAMGIRPESGLAERVGLALGEAGAIQVNERCQTSDPGIHAAGDCATQHHLVSGRRVFLAQALAANRQGRIAGANAALDLLGRGAEAPTDPGTVGTAVKKIFDLEVGHTGLTLGRARRVGLHAFATTITANTRAGYYPGAGPMKVSLIAERGSGRLLGAQTVGYAGAAKRVDVVATALQARFDLEQLATLDLGYAPPFSPLWDPILVAARVAAKKV